MASRACGYGTRKWDLWHHLRGRVRAALVATRPPRLFAIGENVRNKQKTRRACVCIIATYCAVKVTRTNSIHLALPYTAVQCVWMRPILWGYFYVDVTG